MFLYSCYYLILNEDYYFFSGDVIYFLTMGSISICFGLMCGSISMLSSYYFVERIYQASAHNEINLQTKI